MDIYEIVKKLEPCPWCKELPRYSKGTELCNYDHVGNHYDDIRKIPAERIECSNVKCKVRPDLTRINANDAIKIWNGCSKGLDKLDENVAWDNLDICGRR